MKLAAGSGRARVRPEAGRDAVVRTPEGPAPGGLDGVQAGLPVDRAERAGLGEGLRDGRGERPAADLHDDPVQRPALPGQLRDHLEPERLAALDGQAVLVALAGERDRPRGDRLAEPVDRRVAGYARLTLAHHDPCLELLEPFQHHGVGPRQHVDVQPSPGSPGHDRGRQRGIAAGGDRERL